MRSAHIRTCRGFTMAEMLTVITIIGILVLISVPNIMKIIKMTRIRTDSNDLLIKMRYARSLAIKTRRELEVIIDPAEESIAIIKPGHTEYNLLKDIATAVGAGQPLDDSYLLYVEKSGKICVPSWGNSQVSNDSCRYYIGESKKNNGFDNFSTTCPGRKLVFQPSGVAMSTCSLIIKSTELNRRYELKVYKGGQMVIYEHL